MLPTSNSLLPTPDSSINIHSATDQRLFLIGYRGTGKSTVARIIAARLGWDAVDSDDEVRAVDGRSIAAIFAEEGEGRFRDLEECVLQGLIPRERTVVSLGGGAVLRAGTRQKIVDAGPVVWLTAPPEALAERIAQDIASAAVRPRLTTLPPLEEVERLLAQRTPLYRECATFAVPTEGRTPEEVADEVLRRLTKAPAQPR